MTYALSHVAGLADRSEHDDGCVVQHLRHLQRAGDGHVQRAERCGAANGSASFDVTIDANAGAGRTASLYGGYVVLTPQGGGARYRVPFAGFKGGYQSTQVLTPTATGSRGWRKLVGASFFNQPTGATYTLANGDIPYFLLHLDHMSRKILLEAFDAKTGSCMAPRSASTST